MASFTDKDENINVESPTAEWELNFSEQNRPNGYRVTQVSISVYFESLEDLRKMIEMGFKEDFTITINELTNVLKTLTK